MKITSFHAGLSLTLNDEAFCIARIYESGECILERMSDHALLQRSKIELMKLFEEGLIHLDGKNIEQKNKTSMDLASFNEEQQKSIIRKKEYIVGAQKILGERPTTINLKYAISSVGEHLNDKNLPSVSSVIRWWKTWIQSGKDIISLTDKKPGLFKTRRFKGEKKIIQEVIEANYLTQQRTSIQDVYDLLCYRMIETNKARLNPLKIPSRATFYRIIRNLDRYECMVSREGKNIADRHFRAVGAGVVTKYILERVEVDHTPLDVMVVNEKTGLADGRPWITVLLDKYSRMPLGIEIGFEPPSEIAVMNALHNAIKPKTEINKKYPEISGDWPAYGLPNTLVCDNGAEFHSKNLKRMCAELNIEIQFCPKKQPNYKGSVERFLGTLNRAVCHRIPGTTFSNIQQRNEYQSEKLAKIKLNDLKELICEWIIDIYNHETNRITGKSPYELWKLGLKQREPLLPESMQQLDLIISKELQRKLNHEGVKIFGLTYNSAELGELRKRSENTFNVRLRFNPSNMSFVQVYDDVNGDYIRVPSIHPEYTDGLSLLEHKAIKVMDKPNLEREQDVMSLLKKKAKFSEKLNELSLSKKIRPRQKAERHSLHKQDHTKTKERISEINKQDSIKFVELNIEEIPRFNTSKRGDF